jgi:hypothetical protein
MLTSLTVIFACDSLRIAPHFKERNYNMKKIFVSTGIALLLLIVSSLVLVGLMAFVPLSVASADGPVVEGPIHEEGTACSIQLISSCL